ncbi:hypothetical protein BBIA_2405 [Bifidobacterium biavatii DSM 23969]|uniref:Uncharacterized protein n=1 Tax=Bifidobacterium biavatii DSM 23969 TaxID=1437608 RepID=A0A086ZD97_9BIFI|nr:hypothetical protein BBIA_2405 [Bifidobacterium biavatii DSM 23969]
MGKWASVAVCPRCGHPVHWRWHGNSIKTSQPCDCCGWGGTVTMLRIPAKTARAELRRMHETALRDWKQGVEAPKRVWGAPSDSTGSGGTKKPLGR